MPLGPIAGAGILLGLKGLGSLFKGKAKAKQNTENRTATISGLNLQQKMGEDKRRARLQLAQSILGGVPGFGLDPAIVQQLMQERQYDFGPAVPRQVGGISNFLGDVFHGASEVIPYAYSSGQTPMSPGQPTYGAQPGTAGQTVTLESLIADILAKRKRSQPSSPVPYNSADWQE